MKIAQTQTKDIPIKSTDLFIPCFKNYIIFFKNRKLYLSSNEKKKTRKREL